MNRADANSQKMQRKLALALLSLLAVMAIGTLGYHLLGVPEPSWLDSFYMTFVTISTIGYHEVVDVSHYQYGRLFTIFIGMTGIGVLGYVLSTVTAFMLESDLNMSWRRKKMLQTLSKMRDHYIVCGIGRVGSNVAHELAATGRPCVVIDSDLRNLESYLDKHPAQPYLHADASDNDVLLAAGVEHARGLFAVASDDSMNLVICLSAKQLNPDLRVVARCHDLKNVEKTRHAGADEIVSPDFTGGLRIVSAMLRPQVVTFLDEMLRTDNNLRMEEFTVPAGFSGKPLGVINLTSRSYVVLAIRQNKEWVFNPDAQQQINEGDVLMVMTTPEGRNRLEHLMQGVG